MLKRLAVLTSVYFRSQAVSALQQIGISTAASLAYRAKLAFVAQIGNSATTLYQMLPRNSTYVQIVANIQGQRTNDRF